MRVLKAAPKLRFIVLELVHIPKTQTAAKIQSYILFDVLTRPYFSSLFSLSSMALELEIRSWAGTNRVVFLNVYCLLLNILTGGNTEEQKKRNKLKDTS